MAGRAWSKPVNGGRCRARLEISRFYLPSVGVHETASHAPASCGSGPGPDICFMFFFIILSSFRLKMKKNERFIRRPHRSRARVGPEIKFIDLCRPTTHVADSMLDPNRVWLVCMPVQPILTSSFYYIVYFPLSLFFVWWFDFFSAIHYARLMFFVVEVSPLSLLLRLINCDGSTRYSPYLGAQGWCRVWIWGLFTIAPYRCAWYSILQNQALDVASYNSFMIPHLMQTTISQNQMCHLLDISLLIRIRPTKS